MGVKSPKGSRKLPSRVCRSRRLRRWDGIADSRGRIAKHLTYSGSMSTIIVAVGNGVCLSKR